MIKKATAAAVVATALPMSSPAVGEADEIRARLLESPVWEYEWTYPGKATPPNIGKVSFAEKDGKLVGRIDVGWKCDNEVAMQPDGFELMTCNETDLRYVASGNEFKATFGNYVYTIRPVP